MTELLEGITQGDARSIARAATLIENRDPKADRLLRDLFPRTGRATVVGITGATGAGKSTLASALVALLRAEDQRVGVLAVDPTSPFTGGAILGDRIRMQAHHADPHVFIRSMATRGVMGGLAAATADLALLLDAAGYEWILVETVGVGQDEIDIARLADVTVLVLVPNLGDDVQALKAGILEIADVYAINKSDLNGAAKLQGELEGMLALAGMRGAWTPPMVRTVAGSGQGAPELLAAVRAFLAACPKRRRSALHWSFRLREMYAARALARLDNARVDAAAARVAAREQDPYSIVEEWLS